MSCWTLEFLKIIIFRAQRELDQQKQQIQEKEKSKPVVVEKPIDPAIQAELDAQQERNKVTFFTLNVYNVFLKLPLEHRVRKFRELLEEKKVSANSTWEKELSKIVFDQRYLLLSAVERKAVRFFNCGAGVKAHHFYRHSKRTLVNVRKSNAPKRRKRPKLRKKNSRNCCWRQNYTESKIFVVVTIL